MFRSGPSRSHECMRAVASATTQRLRRKSDRVDAPSRRCGWRFEERRVGEAEESRREFDFDADRGSRWLDTGREAPGPESAGFHLDPAPEGRDDPPERSGVSKPGGERTPNVLKLALRNYIEWLPEAMTLPLSEGRHPNEARKE